MSEIQFGVNLHTVSSQQCAVAIDDDGRDMPSGLLPHPRGRRASAAPGGACARSWAVRPSPQPWARVSKTFCRRRAASSASGRSSSRPITAAMIRGSSI